jgi:aryl-alcohol dehydrogenase-like predicted oxidoreductase
VKNFKKLGLGGAMLGSVSGLSLAKSVELLELAYEKGIRYFDTANIYGQGDSERAIGQLYNKHNDCVFSSKAGYRMPTSGSSKGSLVKKLARIAVKKMPFLKKRLMKMRSSAVSAQDFSFESVSSSLADSLERLQVKQIPIFMLHSPSKIILENKSFCSVLEKLKQEGKIRKSGLALISVEDIFKLNQLDIIDVLQVELNLLSPMEHFAFLKEIKEKYDITIVARQPFASSKLIHGNDESNECMRELKSLAENSGLSLAQLALSGLASLPFIDQVLVGTTKEANLLKNVEYMSAELPEPVVLEIQNILGMTL